MKAALVLFDRLTALDFVGFYDPLTRLKSMKIMPDFEWSLCALQGSVSDDRGLRFTPDRVGKPLAGFDLLFVPGGYGTRPLMEDASFLDWLRTAAEVPLKISVCTGSLLLGAAGFLRGKPATTHPSWLADLTPFCSEVVKRRIVDAGDVITAGGVAASIDLGLYVVERIAGREAREKTARQMDYPYG
jgi:transcriptional regulator GlxA family with amidase domain